MGLEIKSEKLGVASIIVLFLISLSPTASGYCSYDLDINIVAVKSIYDPIPEKYQFPDFEEGTILHLESFIVTNTGNCTFSEDRIEPVIISPSGKEYKFGNVPLDMSDFPLPNQTKSYNRKRGRGRMLDEIGKWEIEMRTVEGQGPSNTRVGGSWLKEFNVHSRFEIKNIETASSNLEMVKWSLIAVIISIIALVYYETQLRQPEINI